MAEHYNLNIRDAITSAKSSAGGLSSTEAESRLKEFGPNELQKAKKSTVVGLFLSQFKNALIVLLVFAGILSMFLGEELESIAIFGIILLNAVLGFAQEYQAEKAIEALERISAPTARVLRDEKEKKIPAREVVPGDILILEAGDIVPADSRIIEVSSLQIDEASLTGESVPSKKVTDPFPLGTSIADQENMAFMGTTVTYGKGKCVVTSTGMKTEFGKIAKSLQTTEDTQTPLQIKFSQLAKQIGAVAIVLIIITLAAGTLQGATTFGEMVIFALTLTISTIPNSLPVIVTVGLSTGTRRLSKKNMLIRKLPAAESLGAATVIASDKTGTITKNQMTITDIFFDGQLIKVTGTGYEPKGGFYAGGELIPPKQLEILLRAGYLCNNAKLTLEDGRYGIIGDPTEGSLIVLGEKGGLSDKTFCPRFSFIEELPFDSDRKRMSSIFKDMADDRIEAYVKGAPDLLLNACGRIILNGRIAELTEKDRKELLKVNDSFAGNALRVLALAYRELPKLDTYSIEDVEKDLIFIGFVGMIDPPRDEVAAAIQQCREAGIEVMIITGDHPLTTQAIARQIGLFTEGDIVLTGSDVEKMSDSELENKIDDVRIIARALPIQKSRIVDALQKRGHIVAMTGDGVNDAPALKKADIGIAMGITGTDVAKEVSQATLTDDNFATIVNAIEEGRNIYEKIIKSARYLLSCNAGEITSVFMAIMLKFPLPMLPLQILLMNLLTDDLPALGLGAEANDHNAMKRPPRNPKEKPLSRNMLLSIVIFGFIMGIGTLLMFMQYLETSLSKAQTVAFTTLVAFQMFAVMSSRSLYPSLRHLNPFTNTLLLGAVCMSLVIQMAVIYWPPLQAVFGTVPLTLVDWISIICVSSLGFIMMELSKFFFEREKKHANHSR